MSRSSLSRRLALAAAALVLLSLLAADGLVIFMYQGHVERRFDRALGDHMEELVAASEIGDGGRLVMSWRPADPRFSRPGSGWYWQISLARRVLEQSLSLNRMTLDAAARTGAGTAVLDGPTGTRLRLVRRTITLPGSEAAFHFAVAGPVSDISEDVWRFSGITGVTLFVLALGLSAAVLLQVRFGLLPLAVLRRALADIRNGRVQRMPEDFPLEIKPLVEELNALLDHNTALLARARTQAGNLAHALKHPLMVVAQQAREIKGAEGRLLGEQVEVINAAVNRHLSRARIAGPDGAVGVSTKVADVFDGLRYSLDLLYRDRGLAIGGRGLDGVFFAGDGQDLEDMLGNLMDNACKWGRSRVDVTARIVDGRVFITVEDDGPGIAASDREAALGRGRRFDEAVAGTGLGLDIVRDIAELYRGTLGLSSSGLGGLKAVLDLPAASPA